LHLLQANFRNTGAVTALANRLLKIKQARFGSVDRESNFLVRSTSTLAGEVLLLDDPSQIHTLVVQQAHGGASAIVFQRWRRRQSLCERTLRNCGRISGTSVSMMLQSVSTSIPR
jgi:hypothetical protein